MSSTKGKKQPEIVNLDAIEDGEEIASEQNIRGVPAKLSDLYSCLSTKEKALLIFATICSFIRGAAWPVWTVFFGEAINIISDVNETDVSGAVQDLGILFVIVGAIEGVLAFFEVPLTQTMAARISTRLRAQFVEHVIRQDMAWHDEHPSAALDVVLSRSGPKIYDGLASNWSQLWQHSCELLLGVTISFFYSWKLSLVFLASSPLMLGAFMMFFTVALTFEATTSKIYQKAGVVVDEVLSLLRTVISFGTYKMENKRYSDLLVDVKAKSKKTGVILGLSIGLPDFALLLMYSLGFWYGAKLTREGDIEGGDIMIVLFNMLIGIVGGGQASTHYRKYQEARVAAEELFEVIRRPSEIDALSKDGKQPEKLEGLIEFRNVDFAYPSTPNVPVLRDLSFTAKPGETIAFVGHSGSGKSTVVSLLERFYDPQGGKVLLDGMPISDFNVQWVRQHIGLVTQTPVLLPKTIFENIAMGKEDATREEVIAAAKLANAHNFIQDFPDGYDTFVGHLGSQLSGGQRQRLAIARVLCGNPKLLLLDEATSALDNQSEAIVQAALDAASSGRTTIVIAHRLSTVQNADKIIVLDHGKIVEQGNHDELMQLRGVYAGMAAHDSVGRRNTQVFETVESEGTQVEAEENTEEDGKVSENDSLAKIPVFRWAWQMSRKDMLPVLLSFLFAILAGLVWPVNAILLSESMTVIQQEGAQESDITRWCLLYVGLACANLLFHFMRTWLAFVAGEALTYRLRKQLFWMFTHQPAGWHDNPSHSVGHLTQLLSNDASKVRILVADYIQAALVVIAMLLGGILIALFFCWKIALVVLATIPFLAASGMLMQLEGVTTETGNADDYAQATAQATDLMTNIRLVTSLGRVSEVFSSYASTLEVPLKKIEKKSWKFGFAHIFAELAKFGAFGLAFWYGGIVIDDGDCDFTDMFKALTSVLFSGILGGMYAAQLPNLGAAKVSTAKLRKIFDACEEIDESEDAGQTAVLQGSNPTIEFKNVSFVYPTRPEAKVLDNFSLTIPGGKTVALVGPSGSGKSTIISLIQRLYEVDEGEILVDGVSIKDTNAEALRKGMVVVEQEPRLFATTISSNIAYGLPSASEKEIQFAAEQANAAQFISELDKQYDTNVGKFGSILSGGQRQRVAIARASIRSDGVKVLLLDEATSALDVNTEKLVQAAMDRARAGKTTVIVAHRLSTIKAADIIAVMKDGQIVEQGSHRELMALKGLYSGLYTVVEGEEQLDESSEPSPVATIREVTL